MSVLLPGMYYCDSDGKFDRNHEDHVISRRNRTGHFVKRGSLEEGKTFRMKLKKKTKNSHFRV